MSSLLSELAVQHSPVIIHCFGYSGLTLYPSLEQVRHNIQEEMTEIISRM